MHATLADNPYGEVNRVRNARVTLRLVLRSEIFPVAELEPEETSPSSRSTSGELRYCGQTSTWRRTSRRRRSTTGHHANPSFASAKNARSELLGDCLHPRHDPHSGPYIRTFLQALLAGISGQISGQRLEAAILAKKEPLCLQGKEGRARQDSNLRPSDS